MKRISVNSTWCGAMLETASEVLSKPYTTYGCLPTSVTIQPASIAINPVGEISKHHLWKLLEVNNLFLKNK